MKVFRIFRILGHKRGNHYCCPFVHFVLARKICGFPVDEELMVLWNFTTDLVRGKVKEEEISERMDEGAEAFDADPDRDRDDSVAEEGTEISYTSTMEAAILEMQNEREQEMARLRSFHQGHVQQRPQERVQQEHHQSDLGHQHQVVVLQQHRYRGTHSLGFELAVEVTGANGNFGSREGVAERGTSYSLSEGCSSSEQLSFHDTDTEIENERKLVHLMDRTALMNRREEDGMTLKREQERGRGQDRMKRQAAFGALAATAVAVNVALQSISGAGSIVLNPTADSGLEHRKFRKRRRRNEEESDFIPAILSTFADAEVMASLSYVPDSSPKDPFLFDDYDWYLTPRSRRWWKKLFRVPKPTFDYICQLVKPDIESDTPASFQGIEGRVITVEKQVAIALRRLASGDSLTTLGEFFGVGESTVSKVIWKFVNSMVNRASQHMQWPEGEEMERVKAGFEVDHGLPNCYGVIDLTHIIMELPGTDSSMDWLDAEQNYSMLMQVVVDVDMKIRDLFTGWPGSITDSHLLRNSGFYAICESGERLNGPSQTVNGAQVREHIIGDSGYPLLPWLINPYATTGSSPSRDTFNSKHASTKTLVEDALGRLKGAWKILHKVLWRPDIRKLPSIIHVCCLLHNILIEAGEDLEDGVALVGHHDEGYRQQWCLSVEPEGHLIREALAEHVFASDRH